MATTKGGLAKRQAEIKKDEPIRSMQGLVVKMQDQIKAALTGTALAPERFTRIVLTTLSSNRQLQQCKPETFLGAMMQAAQLGVEPNTPLGQAYLIPYRNHGQLECQFQLGYKGYLSLFYRSGGKDLQAHEVYENDTFEFEFGLEPKLRHIPAMRDRGQVIAYYAVWRTQDGGYGFDVMSVEDVREHMRKFSKAAEKGFSPWSTNFDEMAKKTVIKKALKYAPLSTEFVRAMSADETIKTNIMPDMAADAPNEMQYAEGDVYDTTGSMDDQGEPEQAEAPADKKQVFIDPDAPFTAEEMGDK
ncbi:recombinase RecT [uncultured Acidaminococcus sp.]|uniref:recombinase RecT n=1 Tax=uncultured Acidaminococcus sp. TaxID=352152 RepID=UPI00258A8723|nr:recombinase RecT [uncultured Acidaminococcus sp.]